MVAERGWLELKAVNDTSEVKGYNSELFCGISDSLAYVKCLDCSCCCRYNASLPCVDVGDLAKWKQDSLSLVFSIKYIFTCFCDYGLQTNSTATSVNKRKRL